MASSQFILAPNARWQGRNQTGQPVQNGKLYTYINQTTTPKATYQDYQGLQPNTNPVILDGKGEANIYWATDDLYTIKLFTEDDEEVYTQDNYPVVGTNTTRVIQESQVNVCRNEQFAFWYFGTSFSPVTGLGSQNNNDFVCDDWLYKRTSSTYTVNITRQTFPIDQTDVPNNPQYFFRYEATSTPSGETNNRLYQRYTGVGTFANTAVTVSMYAKSPLASTINVYLVQNFGTGGSPSTEVLTLVGQFILSTTWGRFSGTITLPALTGKVIGTNGDDALELRIGFPNDVVATVDLCDMQTQQGGTLTPFPYEVLDTQFKELNNRVTNALPTTSDIKPTIKTVADPGWVMCNDTTIGNVNSNADTVGFSVKALYTAIWNGVINQYAPIFDSTGAITTRGVSAEADFNALKRLALTKTLGRVIASAGQAVLSSRFTADAASNLLTLLDLVSSSGFLQAVPVTLTTTGTLPAPLLAGTTYYCILTGANTIGLATSAANATAGTPIDITTAGAGVQTITISYTNWALGQMYGEEADGLTVGGLPAHTHIAAASASQFRDLVGSIGAANSIAVNQGVSQLASLANITVNVTNSSTGQGGVHNNIQPTVFLKYMMRL